MDDLSIYAGHLPARAFGLVMEWTSLHQNELKRNWELMGHNLPLQKIEPNK